MTTGSASPQRMIPRADSGSAMRAAGWTMPPQSACPSGGVTSAWNVAIRNGADADPAVAQPPRTTRTRRSLFTLPDDGGLLRRAEADVRLERAAQLGPRERQRHRQIKRRLIEHLLDDV